MHILLGIPVYNEEDNILPFFENLSSKLPKEIEKIVFVNDGSSDNSRIILEDIKNQHKTLIDIVHRYPNEGYGASMIFLLNYAKQNHFEFLITMDCDQQHKPEDLQRFIKVSPNFDIVSGSRYLGESPIAGIDPPIERVKVNQRITKKLNQIFNFQLSDSFCGFKRYKLSNIVPSLLEEKGYAFPIEFWTYAYYKNLSIIEIPVARIYITDDRSFGENLDRHRIRYKYYLKTLKTSLKKFQHLGEKYHGIRGISF